MAKLHRVSVTYSLVTESSVQDGDHADNGYIDARTERRRSFRGGRKRDVERSIRLAQAGKFDFPTIREAIAFIDRQSCAHHESCSTPDERTLCVSATGAYQGRDVETLDGSPVISVDYDLHIQGLSYGSGDRLARVLAANGVYFANRRDLQRKTAFLGSVAVLLPAVG